MTIHGEISRILLSYTREIRALADLIESLVENLMWGYREQEIQVLFLYAEKFKNMSASLNRFVLECSINPELKPKLERSPKIKGF